MDLARLRAQDHALTEKLQLQDRGTPLYFTAVFFAHAGDSALCLLVLVLTFLSADIPWKLLAGTMTLSMLLVSALTGLIKIGFRRSRPPGEWGQVYRATDPHSFPSGHAARTFLLCTLAVGLGPAWLAALLCLWAPFVSLARIALAVHYVSDVAVGVALGVLSGILILILLPGFEPALHAFLLNLL